jgi:hypothetical protein
MNIRVIGISKARQNQVPTSPSLERVGSGEPEVVRADRVGLADEVALAEVQNEAVLADRAHLDRERLRVAVKQEKAQEHQRQR